MKKATVIREFNGVEDGKIYPRSFKVGDTISGDLARAEVENGRAEWEGGDKKKPPANKALDGPDRNKQSSASQQARASRKKTAKKSKASAES